MILIMIYEVYCFAGHGALTPCCWPLGTETGWSALRLLLSNRLTDLGWLSWSPQPVANHKDGCA